MSTPRALIFEALVKELKINAVPLLGTIVTAYFFRIGLLDREYNRLTTFRGKSALYGKEYGPDDEPPWPHRGYNPYNWRVNGEDKERLLAKQKKAASSEVTMY